MSGTSGTVLVPADIDPTGKADVSAKMQALVDGLKDGWTLKFQPGAVYRCEHTLTLTSRTNIVIDENGGEIRANVAAPYSVTTHGVPAKALNQQRANYTLIDCTGCWIINGTIRGSQTDPAGNYQDAYAFQHAINVQGGSGNKFEDLTIRDVRGDFFAFDPVVGTVKLARMFHVNRCDCSGASRQGLSFAGSADGLIENSKFRNGARHAIDFESDRPFRLGTEPIQRIQFRNNQFGPGWFQLGFMSIGGLGAIAEDIIIGGLLGHPEDGNTLIGQSMDILARLNGEPAQGTTPARPGGRIQRLTIGYNTSDTPHGQGENVTDPVTHVTTHIDHGLIQATHVDTLDVFFNHALVQIGTGNDFVLATGCTDVNVHDNVCPGASLEVHLLPG